MSYFNLIEEPWIRVITDSKGSVKEVSLQDFFENAHKYKDLGGDSVTQDFALTRVLLSILYTVFYRVNADGESYPYLELGDRFCVVEKVDEDDINEYKLGLIQTWLDIWHQKEFPLVIIEYLNAWKDRFYLLDEKYPFFQVTKNDIRPEKLSKDHPSIMAGKNINRLISESANKVALFSPKYAKDNNKEKLSYPEIARWLITLQGYAGLSDKVIFGKEKYKASKGWLFDLGGILLKGQNLFETLMLNLVLVKESSDCFEQSQKPCWEYSSQAVIEASFSGENSDNIAGLYTAWSRGVYIDPEIKDGEVFECKIVKLPDINHKDNFVETMTLWRHNENGENKDSFTPRKHTLNQSMWRSFGLLTIEGKDSEKIRMPGVIGWLKKIKKIELTELLEKNIIISAISMQDDGNATSWVPTDEIIDSLSIDEWILTDDKEAGWVNRINNSVEFTKKIVGFNYKQFLKEIAEIRKLDLDKFVPERLEDLYFKIDQPFKEWVSKLSKDDDPDIKELEWKKTLKTIIIQQAKEEVFKAGPRDYLGVLVGEKGIKNLPIVFNKFLYFLGKDFKEERK